MLGREEWLYINFWVFYACLCLIQIGIIMAKQCIIVHTSTHCICNQHGTCCPSIRGIRILSIATETESQFAQIIYNLIGL